MVVAYPVLEPAAIISPTSSPAWVWGSVPDEAPGSTVMMKHLDVPVGIRVDQLVPNIRVACACDLYPLVDPGQLAIEWEQSVVSAHHALTHIAMFSEDEPLTLRDEWASAHNNLHHSLLAGCANSRLLDTAGRPRASAELYRRWSTSLGDEPDRDLAAEHKRLCDLALAKDVTRGVQELKGHIRHTSDLLLRRAAPCEVEEFPPQ